MSVVPLFFVFWYMMYALSVCNQFFLMKSFCCYSLMTFSISFELQFSLMLQITLFSIYVFRLPQSFFSKACLGLRFSNTSHSLAFVRYCFCSLLPLNFFLKIYTHTQSQLFFSAVLGLHCCVSSSLVVESRGYSLVVLGLLTVLASLVMEHGLWGTQASVVGARGLSSCCSWASEHKLSSCGTGAQLL